MTVFSFLHRLVCKICKTTTNSNRAKRRKERHEERLQRLQRLEQDEWQPSWMRETCDVVISNEHSNEETFSVVELDISPTQSCVSLSSVSSLSPFAPAFPVFTVAPAFPVIPSPPAAIDIATATTTTLTTTAITTDQYSSSSATLLTSSSRTSLTKVPAVRDLRRLSNISYTASYTPPPPPQLTLSWEHAPPSPLIPELQYYNASTLVPTTFAAVKPLPRRPMGPRYPLLLLDGASDDGSESKSESESGESGEYSFSSSSPPSFASPISPAPSSASSASASSVSSTPLVPTVSEHLVPALPKDELWVSRISCARGNFQRNSKISPLMSRRISGGNFGDNNNSDTTTAPNGARYIPSSKTTPRPRPTRQRSTPQQTLPFLCTSTTFDEILASKTSSTSAQTPTTFDEILAPASRPPPRSLIRRKPIPVSLPVIQTPAAPTVETLPNEIIRPYKKRPTRHAQHMLSLSLLSSSSSSSSSGNIPYNSRQGYSMLQALRRLLIVPVDWSAAQTLLFVLQHPAVRRLALPFDQSSSPASDLFRDLHTLDWYGILQAIDGPIRYLATHKRSDKNLSLNLRAVPPALASCSNPRALSASVPFSVAERDLVAYWLTSGEPLFTRQMTLPTVLLRKSGQPPRGKAQPLCGRTPLSPLASSSVYSGNDALLAQHIEPATRYDIARNPRCRYHQLWTGAGKSRLSISLLAEIDV